MGSSYISNRLPVIPVEVLNYHLRVVTKEGKKKYSEGRKKKLLLFFEENLTK